MELTPLVSYGAHEAKVVCWHRYVPWYVGPVYRINHILQPLRNFVVSLRNSVVVKYRGVDPPGELPVRLACCGVDRTRLFDRLTLSSSFWGSPSRQNPNWGARSSGRSSSLALLHKLCLELSSSSVTTAELMQRREAPVTIITPSMLAGVVEIRGAAF